MLVLLQRCSYALMVMAGLSLTGVHANPASAKTITPSQATQLAGKGMQWVKAHYGEPPSIWYSEGKVKPQWPKITVWDYGTFAVFFEQKTVLHTVIR
ncbi:MAG: hypothetical protein WAQ53_11900 [Thiofilum sp.]|uniref:hypothetical protein n=1 Tax=Thiofilum sp. TaxID=2212733 RepID=UPI0025E1A702|nr:hypothetical protein [Thiofilum sp.]MBK8454215.1 hypothetical protein [Thiofilum sp.]